jgi:ABC-type sugar transport system ATPase subunit
MYPKRQVEKGDVLIEVEDLTVKKIRHVSLSVREGEVVGLFGLMGAGRTELVESIFGVHKIKSGKIRIHGREVVIRSPLNAIKQGIAYVPSERKQDGLILSHSVKANVTIASLKKYKRGISLNLTKENQRVQQWIEKLDIKSARVNTLVETLSGGNQQKVVLAKWLENEPKILILNEPTRGIDVGAKVEIYRILEMLCKNKIGVLMISSELPEIMSIADRIVVIHDGQLMGECAQEEVNQEKLMNLAIGGEN